MRSFSFAFLLALFMIVTACDMDADLESTTEPDDEDVPQLPAEEVVQERVDTEEESFRLVRILGDLENPWAVAWLDDTEILISERPGRLVYFDGEQRREVSGLPEISAQNQGGLLDIMPHPDYADNGWIYFTYSEPSGEETATALARAQFDGESLTDMEVLYSQDPPQSPGRHYGSRIAFMDDGTLIFSIGDRGLQDPAQDLGDPAGSVIRINAEDGSIPDDNPFVDDDAARDEIYSYGHRNIQGMIIQDGTIWSHEHGPRGGDEINIVEAGENYGWPEVTYGLTYSDGAEIGVDEREDTATPITYWAPSIAPSGLAYYDGEHFENWNGNLFVGALAQQHIRRVVLDGEEVSHEEEILRDEIGRIRDVRQGPDGYLYVLTDASDGALYRLESVEEGSEAMEGEAAEQSINEEAADTLENQDS